VARESAPRGRNWYQNSQNYHERHSPIADIPRWADGEETEQRGRRKLAYPIKKFMEGDYILTRFKLEPKLVKALEADLAASEEILRQLIVKVGD